MKKSLLVLAFLATLQTMLAQNITGRIVDEKNLPVEFVNVVALSLPDSAFIAGAVSDQNGDFSISTPNSKCLLKISSVGYKSITHPLTSLQAGTIVIRNDSQLLDEVVVKAYRPAYKLTGNGITANIQNSVLSKSGTANDVLKHIPSVQEKDNGFVVFGKGSPLIYINGKQIRDKSELDNLKSENIKSVELITNPGASYDATVKSVIKIKTINLQGDGFGFDVRSSYNQSQNTDLIEQVNLNYSHNKIYLFGTFKYTRNVSLQKSKVEQTVFVDTLWNQMNNLRNVDKNSSYQNIAGLNYSINSDHSIGAKYTMNVYPDADSHSTLESEVFADNKFYDHWNNQEHKKINSSPSHLINIYYNGKVGKTSIDFNTDYLYNKTNQHSLVDEYSENLEDRTVESSNKIKNSMIASKIVISHPLFGGKLNGGGEYIKTERTDNYISFQQFVPTSYSLLKEQTVSPFVEYVRMTPIGQVSAGLRYEWVKFDYYEDHQYVAGQSRKYSHLFPNISFGTQLGKVQMQLSYTAKTKRPTYKQLSNNVFYGNRYTLQSGNPLLKSEIIHDVSLVGLWKFIQFMASYQIDKDAIIYWAEQQQDNPAITRMSYKNLNSLKNLVAFVSFAPKFGIWSPQLNVGIRKQWLDLQANNTNVRMNTPLWMGNFNHTFNLFDNFIFAVDMAYQGKGDYQNVTLTEHQFTVNASVTKSFLNDKLSIQLKGIDLFNGFKDGNLLYNKQMHLYQLNSYDKRAFEFTLRYKFNMSKSKYKGTGAGQNEKDRL